MTAVQKRPVLTVDEFRDALTAFSTADYVRLQKYAATICNGTGFTADDLTQEAVRRALEDEGRNCPRDVKPVVFLGGVIKSIASAERKKWAREKPLGKIETGFDPITQRPDPAPDPERVTIRRISLVQTIDQIETLFADDSQALAIVMGDMDGCSPDEIRELEPMTKMEYATARRRVRRKLQKSFHRGVKHDR